MKIWSFRLLLPRDGEYEVPLMSFGGGDADVKHEGGRRGLMATRLRLNHLRAIGSPDLLSEAA